MPFTDIVLLTPKNDEESLMIGKIALAAKVPTVVSAQPHGARLEKEPDLLERLRLVNPLAKKIVIVEIPGPETEAFLHSQGYDVVIVDHHRYDQLDRMQDESSLEQVLAALGIDDEGLTALGFDPVFVRGVGIIDRGFLWALRTEIADPELRKKIRAYYRSLTLELGKDRVAIEAAAQEAWEQRETFGDVLIVRSPKTGVSIRDAVSFLLADAYDVPPQVIVVEGERRLFVQESDYSAELFATYGGFTFGRDRCWGVQASPDKKLPDIKEILEKIATKTA